MLAMGAASMQRIADVVRGSEISLNLKGSEGRGQASLLIVDQHSVYFSRGLTALLR